MQAMDLDNDSRLCNAGITTESLAGVGLDMGQASKHPAAAPAAGWGAVPGPHADAPIGLVRRHHAHTFG